MEDCFPKWLCETQSTRSNAQDRIQSEAQSLRRQPRPQHGPGTVRTKGNTDSYVLQAFAMFAVEGGDTLGCFRRQHPGGHPMRTWPNTGDVHRARLMTEDKATWLSAERAASPCIGCGLPLGDHVAGNRWLTPYIAHKKAIKHWDRGSNANCLRIPTNR